MTVLQYKAYFGHCKDFLNTLQGSGTNITKKYFRSKNRPLESCVSTAGKMLASWPDVMSLFLRCGSGRSGLPDQPGLLSTPGKRPQN